MLSPGRSPGSAVALSAAGLTAFLTMSYLVPIDAVAQSGGDGEWERMKDEGRGMKGEGTKVQSGRGGRGKGQWVEGETLRQAQGREEDEEGV